jgi:hypothetical protein
MRRFSIRCLMAFVLVSAVGLAALRNANDLWARTMTLVALAVRGVAVLGSALRGARTGRGGWALPYSPSVTSAGHLYLGPYFTSARSSCSTIFVSGCFHPSRWL